MKNLFWVGLILLLLFDRVSATNQQGDYTVRFHQGYEGYIYVCPPEYTFKVSGQVVTVPGKYSLEKAWKQDGVGETEYSHEDVDSSDGLIQFEIEGVWNPDYLGTPQQRNLHFGVSLRDSEGRLLRPVGKNWFDVNRKCDAATATATNTATTVTPTATATSTATETPPQGNPELPFHRIFLGWVLGKPIPTPTSTPTATPRPERPRRTATPTLTSTATQPPEPTRPKETPITATPAPASLP